MSVSQYSVARTQRNQQAAEILSLCVRFSPCAYFTILAISKPYTTLTLRGVMKEIETKWIFFCSASFNLL